ncbi:tetratricopeptide repeat protein [Kordiimonas aquimaris]|uniref:tetratricopeptide repeat protein n=1 Tax=Kordiimonas aquimaris TaxID=707591 RepID=UPI0021D09C17|nr:hypothetical protein [Kordiimonas aquimaris]
MFSRSLNIIKYSLVFVWLHTLAFVALAQPSNNELTLQAAQQSNYSRLVIDIPATSNYSVNLSGRTLTINVDGTFAVDTSALTAASLVQVGRAAVSQSNGNTSLSFDVLPGVNPRDFRSSDYVIVDVYGGDQNVTLDRSVRQLLTQPATSTNQGLAPTTGASSNEESQTVAPTGEAAADPVNTESSEETGPTNPLPVQTVVGSANRDADTEPQSNGEPATDDPIVDAANSDSDDEPLADETAQTDMEPLIAAQQDTTTDVDESLRENVSAIEIGNMEAVDDGTNTVDVRTEALEDSIKVSFNLPSEASAAVFERGGVLWAVFDKPFALDPTGFQEGGREVSRRIRRVEQRPHEDALILRMNIRDNQNFIVEREVSTWHLYLKDTPAKPRFPLRPTRREDEVQGQQIFIQASDVGRRIEFEDPDIGDLLVVLPVLRQSTGMAQKYNYAAAELLETSQGIAVSPLSDNVVVERFRDGVAIRATGNNLLSASRLSRSTGIGSDLNGGFSRLIDFETWRIGESWEYRKNKSRLLYELSLADIENANDVRWKLARYYLAHGRAAEAIGVLTMMLRQDELLTQNSEFRAVRGVANFKQGRLSEAASDLAVPELAAEQDAELWRAMVAEARGQNEQALEFYRRGKDVMGTYDEYDRAELQLAVIRASIETNNLELAQQELDLMNGLTLTEAQLSETVYQSARIAEMQGQLDEALTQYDDLTESPERWISARARYSRVKFGLKNGDISPDVAIDQLERLRYAWRGDRFESLLLNDLAELYFETSQFESGLETLRQGVSYYPDIARDMRMSIRMGEVFRSLFLNGRADELTPIGAISLFYKFRELTPLGSDGDLMIRRLADRLVSVDLLDRAAELLQYQVQARTEGAARAQIAANLAKIYILGREPQRALETLRATREPRLPQDILADRRHVEARALIELESYEEAEVLIEDDQSADAEVLRADAYWGGKDWTRLSSTIRKLLGDGWRRNQALTGLQRLNLIRLSIAMSFTEDRAGLIELRRRYGNQMRDGDFALAFELLTNDQELSGRELGAIATQIASVEKLQTFMRDYRNDFTGR